MHCVSCGCWGVVPGLCGMCGCGAIFGLQLRCGEASPPNTRTPSSAITQPAQYSKTDRRPLYPHTRHTGISLKTQELFLIVFCCRYLDLFFRFISLYNSVMKVRPSGSFGL